jgi:thiol-disulfide isomerase/thioredoxin
MIKELCTFFTLFASIGIINSSDLMAQSVSTIKISELENLMHPTNDTVVLINFWATWCKPCIEELPDFVELEEQFKNSTIKFHYVSLDFKKNLKNSVIPFVEKQLSNKSVFLLDEPDYNSWINKIDSTWKGSIPATLIVYQLQNRFFKEGQLSKSELFTELQQFNLK